MMYLSEFCDVRYEEKHNVVLVEWKNFCCYEDYRKPLEYALDVIKKHENWLKRKKRKTKITAQLTNNTLVIAQ